MRWNKNFIVKRRGIITLGFHYKDFQDIGLRNARLGFGQVEETHLMENIIYNELRMRGFRVDVGVVQKREKNENGVTTKKQLKIDFIANQGSKR